MGVGGEIVAGMVMVNVLEKEKKQKKYACRTV